MEKVKDGTYCVKTSGWPTFLYDLVANQYDRKNKDHSLFCGPLIQVGVLACSYHSMLIQAPGIPSHFYWALVGIWEPKKGNKTIKGRDPSNDGSNRSDNCLCSCSGESEVPTFTN